MLAVQAATENLEVLDLLLSSDVELETPDFRGATPLMFAALSGKTDSARRLLTAGARPGAQDITGWTPLHYAARRGESLGVLLLLLSQEISPKLDQPDFGGTTPLMVAAAYNNPQGASALWDAGADLHLSDNTGRSAIDYARLKNASACVALFESAGAGEKEKK